MTVQLPPVDPSLVEAASALDIAAATTRHKELAAAVERANELYHAKDAPELTDAEYRAYHSFCLKAIDYRSRRHGNPPTDPPAWANGA